ncbi:GntR family transcriptional regulator [Parafrankia sp. EUN1f]|uniref:GntR family transcriptional regulator n=1 Tax=Parafrankia sp. EUN1f TaxID=102897 RepID=UPI0012FB6972|nr:GntR family transcriptional regulator [Parafrankia sp. EUN1f]
MSAESVERVGSATIADHFRKEIELGNLSPGQKLPTIRDIAKDWGVSRPTADKAIAILQMENLVRTAGRGGTTVCGNEDRVDSALLVEVDEDLEISSTEIITASESVARQLNVAAGGSILVVRLRRKARDIA